MLYSLFMNFLFSTKYIRKYYIAPDEYERGVIINSLNEMQNFLITNGKYTEWAVRMNNIRSKEPQNI